MEDVDKDRRYAIDAAIVRIMKSRKVRIRWSVRASCVWGRGTRRAPVFPMCTQLPYLYAATCSPPYLLHA